MSHNAKEKACENPSVIEGEILPRANSKEAAGQSSGSVTLGCGSRSPLVEVGHERRATTQLRGLLPVPAEVEAEILRQEAQHPMAPEYRKTLRDRLTLEHYFSEVEVAFCRTRGGIEILAVGLDEIAEFRATSSHKERLDVVYGVA